LDDVSIEGISTLETEDATESVSTFRAENSSVSWSMGSEDDMSVSTASDGSVASANTLFTFSTNASESLFKPTADKTLLEKIADSTVGKKAVKADDAAVPVHLWNDRINTPTGAESTQGCLEGCRELELRVFRRALYLDCLDYLQATYGEHWQTLEQKKGRHRLTKLGWILKQYETSFGMPAKLASLNTMLALACTSSAGRIDTRRWQEMVSLLCLKDQAHQRNNANPSSMTQQSRSKFAPRS